MIYLLCGVPGSGKTWVINHLPHFNHIPHDSSSRAELISLASAASHKSNKPIIIDCPFDERSLRSSLESRGLRVTPVFIVEHPSVIMSRYKLRTGRWPEQNILTRAETIMNKVNEWGSFYGTSDEVLRHLKGILA